MQNHKIKIRPATMDDRKSIFDWRTDEGSRAMPFNQASPTLEEHNVWFEESIRNVDRMLFIGEMCNEKIGVCRFDLKRAEQRTEVSINMNPKIRGKGLGKKLLLESVEYYLRENEHDLFAKIKPSNQASLDIFHSVGFECLSANEEEIVLGRPFKKIIFKVVDEGDSEVLFDLLKNRKYSISHTAPPTKHEHFAFLKSNPYRYWAIVLEDDRPVGSFYVQNDNSIGINLLELKKYLVHRILRQIECDLEPATEVKSRIPAYFYINVPYANEAFKKILAELDAIPIQTSYRI